MQINDPTGLGRTSFERILDAIGFRIAELGEQLNSSALIYNPLIFHHFQRWGRQSAPSVVETMRALYPDAKTYLDVGCGGGAYAVECQKTGLDVVAVEHSKYGRRMAIKQGVDCRSFDLRKKPATSRCSLAV